MRKIYFSPTGAVWAMAVVLAGAPLANAASGPSNAQLLKAQLPSGETLTAAPIKDVEAAVTAAVLKRPEAADQFVKLAILAKTPKHHAIDCPLVKDIVAAAVKAAPAKAREISEMANALVPDCADSIYDALGAPAPTGGASAANVPGAAPAEGDSGFGAGFGPGFPGSPGFSGSSPSGGFALPTPVPPAVTSTVNG